MIFILYIIGLVFISNLGYSKGDPLLLATPFDPDGNACGESPGFKEYPYIYFTRPSSEYLFYSVCVRTCPNWEKDSDKPNKLECKTNSKVKNCEEKSNIVVSPLDI